MVNEYTLIREMPAGKGYADIVFLPRRKSDKPVMVVELKYDKSAGGAIAQIEERQYPEALEEYAGGAQLSKGNEGILLRDSGVGEMRGPRLAHRSPKWHKRQLCNLEALQPEGNADNRAAQEDAVYSRG